MVAITHSAWKLKYKVSIIVIDKNNIDNDIIYKTDIHFINWFSCLPLSDAGHGDSLEEKLPQGAGM